MLHEIGVEPEMVAYDDFGSHKHLFSTFIKKLVSYKYFYTILFLIIGVILWGGYPRKTELNGTIFGTYYKVIIFAPTFAIQSDSIHQKIIAELQRIDDLYSTYKPS